MNECETLYPEEIAEETAMEQTIIDPEKQAKFREESKDRMNKICQQIGFLEKIANKRSVDYTQKDVEKMFTYLEERLSSCKETFMVRFEEDVKGSAFDFDF